MNCLSPNCPPHSGAGQRTLIAAGAPPWFVLAAVDFMSVIDEDK
jgi:hypothetical protein